MQSPATTFVTPNFSDADNAPMVIVALKRTRRADLVEVGVFLVDTGCLGVKDAFFNQLEPWEEQQFFAKLFAGFEEPVEKSGPWGRKYVESACAYARSFGFKPHADYKKAAKVFGGTRAEDCEETFSFGRKGKPMYVQSEHDCAERAARICTQLRVHCGDDGFDYLLVER
jgi:hypothetical protein